MHAQCPCRWEFEINHRNWERNGFPWKGSKQDFDKLGDVVARLADTIPAHEGGGARLRATFKGSKKAKMATYCFWASPFGTYLLGHLTSIKPDQRHTVQQLLCVLSFINDDAIPEADLPALREAMVKALCLIDLHLPCTELDIKLHNLLHLVDRIPDLGAAWTTAMWGYESLWRFVNNLIKKLDTPETSAMFSWAHMESALLVSEDVAADLLYRQYLPQHDDDFEYGSIHRKQRLYWTSANESAPSVTYKSLPGLAGFGLGSFQRDTLYELHQTYVDHDTGYEMLYGHFLRWLWGQWTADGAQPTELLVSRILNRIRLPNQRRNAVLKQQNGKIVFSSKVNG